MKLENDYYTVTGEEISGEEGVFHIVLRPDCGLYRGHFPGHPVCPGVCNIQTVKECAERMAGRRLDVGEIRRCRLTAVATPGDSPELDVKVRLVPAEKGYGVTATVCDAWRTYMELKGKLTV